MDSFYLFECFLKMVLKLKLFLFIVFETQLEYLKFYRKMHKTAQNHIIHHNFRSQLYIYGIHHK
jgi:hypothetical protein